MIGILTFQETHNFGACLQALGLWRKIKDLGYESEIIDYRNPKIYEAEVKSLQPKYSPVKFLKWFLYTRLRRIRLVNLQNELRRLASFSSNSCAKTDIVNLKYDKYIVGSDQVWAFNYTDYDYTYLLDFVKDDNKKFSFASSIGNETLFKEDSKANELISRFKIISVREEEAAKLIESSTNKDVKWVCDPTMLLTTEEWDNLIKPKCFESGYVLVYFCDPKKKILKDAIDYAKKHNLEVRYINTGKKIPGITNVNPLTMSDWVGLIKHSEVFFSASYHGLLFGLYYHKPLIFYNKNQKSRMESISRYLGIEKNNGDNAIIDSIPEIDYRIVDERINEFRASSVNVLKDILKT